MDEVYSVEVIVAEAEPDCRGEQKRMEPEVPLVFGNEGVRAPKDEPYVGAPAEGYRHFVGEFALDFVGFFLGCWHDNFRIYNLQMNVPLNFLIVGLERAGKSTMINAFANFFERKRFTDEHSILIPNLIYISRTKNYCVRECTYS